MIDYIRCSLRSLGRKKLRTLLTIVSIAIGVASVVLISSIGNIGRQTINQELSSLGLDGITIGKARKDAVSPLCGEELAAIRDSKGVLKATGLNFSYTDLYMRSLVAQGVVFGIDEDTDSFISLEPLYGRTIGRWDLRAAARVCVVDQNVATAFYKRENIVGKTICLSLGGVKENFTVVGVVRSGGNILQGLMSSYIPSFVYIPGSTMQQITGQTDYDQVAVKLEPGRSAQQTGEQIIRSLEARSHIKNGYRAQNIAQQKDTLNNLLEIVTLVLSLIAGVSLVVAGLGIMTVMLVSVNERTHEIGIKKAIGARRPIILLEFLVEAFTITLLGSIIGAALGIGMVTAGCALLQVETTISLPLVFCCILFSVLVGVIFGVYPASIAAKLRPVDALRSI